MREKENVSSEVGVEKKKDIQELVEKLFQELVPKGEINWWGGDLGKDDDVSVITGKLLGEMIKLSSSEERQLFARAVLAKLNESLNGPLKENKTAIERTAIGNVSGRSEMRRSSIKMENKFETVKFIIETFTRAIESHKS